MATNTNVTAPSPENLHLRRKRGCLSGCSIKLLVYFVVGCLLGLLINAVFSPWAFFMGGHFHPLAYWQGWGRMKSSTAGGYVLFVRIMPAPDSPPYQHSHMTGIGYLCTPRGEHFRLTLGADRPRHLGTNVIGKSLCIYMFYWPVWYPQFRSNRRPHLVMHGTWADSELIMDDDKALSHAFLADGTRYTGNNRNYTAGTEDVHFVLKEGSYSDFNSACPAKTP
jgi:hypothetical protein